MTSEKVKKMEIVQRETSDARWAIFAARTRPRETSERLGWPGRGLISFATRKVTRRKTTIDLIEVRSRSYDSHGNLRRQGGRGRGLLGVGGC